MSRSTISAYELNRRFPTPDSAREYMEVKRWGWEASMSLVWRYGTGHQAGHPWLLSLPNLPPYIHGAHGDHHGAVSHPTRQMALHVLPLADLPQGYLLASTRQGNRHHADTVLRDEKTSSHPWAKVGLKALQCFSIEHFRWNSTLAEVGSLAVDLDHFLFVSRDPDRATLFVLDIIGQFGPQSLPQLLRVASQRKLRVAVIHDNDVAHSRSGCAAPNDVLAYHHDTQASTCEFVRTRRTHNAGTDNGNVIGCLTHARMPIHSGSRGSSTNSASAFTNADPLMLGYTLPSCTFTLPSNRLPTMLS